MDHITVYGILAPLRKELPETERLRTRSMICAPMRKADADASAFFRWWHLGSGGRISDEQTAFFLYVSPCLLGVEVNGQPISFKLVFHCLNDIGLFACGLSLFDQNLYPFRYPVFPSGFDQDLFVVCLLVFRYPLHLFFVAGMVIPLPLI